MHPGHLHDVDSKQKTSGLPFNDAYCRLQALPQNPFVAGSPFNAVYLDLFLPHRVAQRGTLTDTGCGRKLIEIAGELWFTVVVVFVYEGEEEWIPNGTGRRWRPTLRGSSTTRRSAR